MGAGGLKSTAWRLLTASLTRCKPATPQNNQLLKVPAVPSWGHDASWISRDRIPKMEASPAQALIQGQVLHQGQQLPLRDGLTAHHSNEPSMSAPKICTTGTNHVLYNAIQPMSTLLPLAPSILSIIYNNQVLFIITSTTYNCQRTTCLSDPTVNVLTRA